LEEELTTKKMGVNTSFLSRVVAILLFFRLACFLRGSVSHDDLDLMYLPVLSLYPFLFFCISIWGMILLFFFFFFFFFFYLFFFSFPPFHEPKPDGEKSRCIDILTV